MAGLAQNPLQIALGLTLIGVFAAIYHPVGLAMVVQDRDKTGMPLAINGVFGNLGVASAALLTGFLIDSAGWRSAFYLPGLLSILLGLAYWRFIARGNAQTKQAAAAATKKPVETSLSRSILVRVFAIIFFTTAIGGLIFQSTTFALPRIFAERLTDFAVSATQVGWYAFLVFTLAAMAQLLIGYLVDHHSLRRGVRGGGAAAGRVFLPDDSLAGPRRFAGGHRLHVCRVRPDSDQRCAGGADGAQRVAQSGLRAALRGDLFRHGLGGATDWLAACQRWLLAPVHAAFDRGKPDIFGDPVVAGWLGPQAA